MSEDEGAVITVRLTPNASTNDIQGWTTDESGQRILKVRVTATPEKLKANKALITLLAKAWKIPPSSITIIKGATERLKTLHITSDIKDRIADDL